MLELVGSRNWGQEDTRPGAQVGGGTGPGGHRYLYSNVHSTLEETIMSYQRRLPRLVLSSLSTNQKALLTYIVTLTNRTWSTRKNLKYNRVPKAACVEAGCRQKKTYLLEQQAVCLSIWHHYTEKYE